MSHHPNILWIPELAAPLPVVGVKLPHQLRAVSLLANMSEDKTGSVEQHLKTLSQKTETMKTITITRQEINIIHNFFTANANLYGTQPGGLPQAKRLREIANDMYAGCVSGNGVTLRIVKKEAKKGI